MRTPSSRRSGTMLARFVKVAETAGVARQTVYNHYSDIDGIVAECGGACACATCHSYIDEAWLDKIPAMDDMEDSMLDAAFELGMFVLLEAFDVAEIERCADLISTYPEHRRNLPLGLNCRDLQTLQIDPARLDAAAGAFPRGTVAVAESGLFNAADARRLAGHGYQLALIGTALMQTDDAAALLREMLEAGRAARGGAM